jgi:hypothetical protein
MARFPKAQAIFHDIRTLIHGLFVLQRQNGTETGVVGPVLIRAPVGSTGRSKLSRKKFHLKFHLTGNKGASTGQ